MTYFVATRDGYLPKLIESEAIARDLAKSGWTVVRVVKTEPLGG